MVTHLKKDLEIKKKNEEAKLPPIQLLRQNFVECHHF